MKLLRIFCAGCNALAVAEFHFAFRFVSVHSASLTVLLFAKSELVDLTFAVLYKPDAQPYYPIASCSGAKTI